MGNYPIHRQVFLLDFFMKITLKTLLPIIFVILSIFMFIPGAKQVTETQNYALSQPGVKISSYVPTFPVYNVKEQMTLSPIFTPDNALDVYLYWLGRANSSIYIQNPYITKFSTTAWPDASPLVKAIVDAKNKNNLLDIKIQVNKDADSGNVTGYFQSIGLPIRWMGNSVSATDKSWISTDHNKLLIIDNKVVIISSINFSENAFKNNRESGMVIQDSTLANDATQVFLSDWHDGETPSFLSLNLLKAQPMNKIAGTEKITYQSPTTISKANFTGVYNVSLFTNPDNADKFVFKYLESAKKSIYVSMYTISRPDFNDTLIKLKKANPSLDIQVLISRDRVGASEDTDTIQAAQSLVANLIPVYNSTSNLDFYHNKYWIIDGKTTFVYSGNWAPASVTPNATSYASDTPNRDMGIAVHDAPDIASFFTNEVWKKDIAAGTAWNLPAGVKQLSFESGDVISGTVKLHAVISNLNHTSFYYRWNTDNFEARNVTNNAFDELFNTSTLPNGVNTFEVKAVTDTNVEFTDSVNVTVANYPTGNNWRVLITEILANPSVTTDALGEFYEITNSFPFDVLLDGWSTGVKDTNFNFPSGYIIPAYTSIIVARNTTGFEQAFSVKADFSYSFSLSNTASYVYLKNNKGDYVDVVAYGMAAPDGSETLIAAPAGKSLQRNPLYIDTNTKTDFITGTPTPKGLVPHNSFNLSTTSTASLPTIFIAISLFILPLLSRLKRKNRI